MADSLHWHKKKFTSLLSIEIYTRLTVVIYMICCSCAFKAAPEMKDAPTTTLI